MIRFFRFSSSRLALLYIALAVAGLALFAIPLWYAWRVNVSSFREYVHGEALQRLVDIYQREGAKGLATAIDSQVKSLAGDEIMILADNSKIRLAGNLQVWPPEVPDAAGTYGLVIGLGGGSTMRVVVSHVRLTGGYHLLIGRESVRFESLVERFWHGIAGAVVIVLVLGVVLRWLIQRGFRSELQEISQTASAIVDGDLSRRVATRGGSNELETLARTVNGMLEKLARQNVQLEGEIAVRRQAEQALHRAHDDLERSVAGRTAQLAQANESLLRAETYLAEAQRLSLTGSFGWDVLSGDIYWSQETFRIFDIDPAIKPTVELILQRTHPEDKARVGQVIESASLQRNDFDFEHRLVMPDGVVKYVRVVGRLLTVGHLGDLEFVGAVTDITERKRAEQRLTAQHTVAKVVAEAANLEEATPKILRAVCESLVWDLGALWSIDRQAGVLRCIEIWHKESVDVPEFEAASRETTFIPGIGLPGRVWFSREPAYIPDVVRDSSFLHAPISGREVLHAAFGFPILLGGEVLGVMEFFSHEIRQPDQELLNMMATLGTQIGQFIERKRAEEALRHAQMELAHVTRVATLGEMTTSIAHEINQPLGAVVNSASACLRWLDAHKLEEARRSASRVIAEGHRASEIISRIRALVKKAPARMESLDVNETIREVIALAQSEVQRNGVALETQLSDDVPLILADRIQLQQVILNLMMNAIEAMSGAGEGPRELLVRSGTDGSQHILVSVQDSGPGLDRNSLDHLFDAFYTTKPHGLGMGLAISRSLLAAHGGRLWATANVPHGAVFQFTLPIDGERVS
jgi:signal transduction histidine kinase/PAS domain-containing protein